MTADNTVASPDLSHCQQRTPSGRRCRMPVSDSGLCLKHAAQKKARDTSSLAARLIGDTEEFTSAVPINRTLGEILKLLARDEIAPRRAAVMAYTCNLLLRTLPAIDRELNPVDDDPQIIIDLPRPDRSEPGDYANSTVPCDVFRTDRRSS
jgi:hypothetical protein